MPMLRGVKLTRLRESPVPRLQMALAVMLIVVTVGVIALLAEGRIALTDAIVFAAAPWAALAAALRPDWLLLAMIAMPANFTAVVQVRRVSILVAVALVALLVTRKKFSLALGTGLATLGAINMAGYLLHANVDPAALEANNGLMRNITLYILLGLLAFNLAILKEVNSRRIGIAFLIGVASTLLVGLAGYGGPWFVASGVGIVRHTYLGYLASGGLGVCMAWVILPEEPADRSLGVLALTMALLALTIAAFGRAVWLAAAITFVLLIFRARRGHYLLILVVAVALALIVPTTRDELASTQTGDIISSIRSGAITSGRADLWEKLWERAEPGLPWGNGFGYMWSLSPQSLFGDPGSFTTGRGAFVPPHDDFLYLLVEFGIPGVVLLGIFWIQLFRAHLRVAESSDAWISRGASLLLGILVTALLTALVDNLFAIRPLAERFFPIAGFIFGLDRLERTRTSERARLPALSDEP